MSQSFGQCSLFLHPEKNSTQNTSSFITELKSIKLLSNEIDSQDKHFYVGEKYLDYVAYMGCAPNIQLKENPDNEKFCFIKIHNQNKNQLIVSKTQIKPPQCPECKKPIKNWQDKIIDTTLLCDICGTTTNIANVNWRKMGGFSNLFIEITDIFPKEAIPQHLLLEKLSKITQTGWLYFYSCH